MISTFPDPRVESITDKAILIKKVERKKSRHSSIFFYFFPPTLQKVWRNLLKITQISRRQSANRFLFLFFSSDKGKKPLSWSVDHRIYWAWPKSIILYAAMWHYLSSMFHTFFYNDSYNNSWQWKRRSVGVPSRDVPSLSLFHTKSPSSSHFPVVT